MWKQSLEMLNIPEGVSPDLVQKLESIQDQLRILINNHGILSESAKLMPEDESIKSQISAVEDYLIQFNNEQKPIIEEIRKEIKTLQQNSSSSVPSEESNASSFENDKENETKKIGGISISPKNNQNVNNPKNKSEKKTARNKIGTKAEVCKMNIKDRMALVRGKKKIKNQNNNQNKKNNSSNNGSNSSRGTSPQNHEETQPKMDDDENGSENSIHSNESSSFNGFEEGFYKAHVTEVKKISHDQRACEELKRLEFEYPIKVDEKILAESDKTSFMHHLNLLTEKDVENLDEYQSLVRSKKREYRNLTYIPEQLEKRQKSAYNWLSADIVSPPLLRTRRRNNNTNPNHQSEESLVIDERPLRRRRTSASNAASRASTPMSKEEEEIEEIEDSVVEEEVDDDEEEGALVMDEMIFQDDESSQNAPIVSDRIEENSLNEEKINENISNISTPNAADIIRDELNLAQTNEELLISGLEPEPKRPRRERGLTEKQRAKLLKNQSEAEKQMEKLRLKFEEVEEAIKSSVGSGLTVATRKERTRQNELLLEKEELESKINKLNQVLNQCKGQLKN